MIKITTSGGKTHEGTLHAVDPVTRSVVLKESDVYTMINPNSIVNISGNLPSIEIATDLVEPSPSEINDMETATLRAIEKGLESLNRNVPGDVQALFDKLSLLYPNCRWQQNHMVVLDDYIIEAPRYSEVKVLPGRDGTGIDRISRTLEGERRRLKMT